ncbi:DSBA family thioredoxin domain containing [Chlorella sorokiniana]|uniref:DSBA family thioredoxin domain containing n=1 Tax=Chlorella sorokiniana TaxID=3076 RepID=A0A2P6U0T3_CHLSO|nr:DSBA family thioredoxin domain containing [Chlorella sorokiniana]|eukprot:PRW59910.1 DSBA family thioredoxin domain containing [Chlorella sorokiniana]
MAVQLKAHQPTRGWRLELEQAAAARALRTAGAGRRAVCRPGQRQREMQRLRPRTVLRHRVLGCQGKKRFDKAVQQLEGRAQVEVVFHPFIIDHGTAPKGEEYLAYNVRRWGCDGWCHDLRRSGRPDGALFSDWKWWPASAKGHQLLLLAQEQGLGRQCKELLLHKTYEQGANLSEVDTLLQCARELGGLGMPEEELRRYLEEDRGRQAVLAEDAAAKRQLKIGGVPYYVIGSGDGEGKRYALSGAQPVSAFVKAVERVLEERQQGSQ